MFLFVVLLQMLIIEGLKNANAQTAGCGGTYNSLSGRLSSPYYPNNYNNSLNCFYYIELSSSSAVSITFLSFNTETCCDWLQISCSVGSSWLSPRFNGSSLPPTLSINSCSRVQLLFNTDGSVVNTGFLLEYNIGNGLEGRLTQKPMNVYLSNDGPGNVVLNCASSSFQSTAYPQWLYSSNGITYSPITATNCSLLYTPGFLVMYNLTMQYSPRTCNLAISWRNNISNAHGVYTCVDPTLGFARAIITSISSSFTTSIDLSRPTTEVVRNDQFTVTCTAQVSVPSTIIQYSLYLYSNKSQDILTTSATSASVVMLASSDILPSCKCDIYFIVLTDSGYETNQPSNVSFSTPSRQVLYWPDNGAMLITGDDEGRVTMNGNLTCFVPANPLPTYQWRDEQSGISSQGPVLNVLHSGTFTCTATNNIRGRTYQASKSITVIIDDHQTSTEPTTFSTNEHGNVPNESEHQLNKVALIVGVILGSAVLLLFVLVVVAFVCLCRKKQPTKGSDRDGGVAKGTSNGGFQTNDSIGLHELSDRGTFYANQAEMAIAAAQNAAYDNITHDYERLRR